MRRLARAVGCAALLLAGTAAATAQDYPNKVIRVIMPLGPGGVGDVFLRAIGQEMGKSLGQSILVENRPGGATNIGSQACAQATPDGYTLCMLPIDAMSIAPFFYKSIPFNPEKDFVADHALLLHRRRHDGAPLAQREHRGRADRAVEGQARTP